MVTTSIFCFQTKKKKSAASPGRILRVHTTRAAPTELAPPLAPAFCSGTTGAPPHSASMNQHSSTADQVAEDHTYGLTSSSTPNQPHKAKSRRRKRAEEREEQCMTSSQDEGGSLGGASAVILDGRQVQKLQEQLQAKVSSNLVHNPTSNPTPSLCLTLVLFCRPK